MMIMITIMMIKIIMMMVLIQDEEDVWSFNLRLVYLSEMLNRAYT